MIVHLLGVHVRAAIILAAAMLTSSCGDIECLFKECGGDPRQLCTENDCCRADQDCFEMKRSRNDPDPSNWACLVEQKRCVQVVRMCIADAMGDTACCPGQLCSMITTEDGLCADTFTACDPSAPAACKVKGQYCEPSFGTRGQLAAGCTFRTCRLNEDCAEGLRCFNGSCVGEAPCEGGCEQGSLCVPSTNRCYGLHDFSSLYVATVPASCRRTCAAGSMLVFANPANIFGVCDPNDRECECAPLPIF